MSHFSPAQVDRLILAAYHGQDTTEYMHDDSAPSYRYIVTGHVQGLDVAHSTAQDNPRWFARLVRHWASNVGSGAETLGVWHDRGRVYIDAGDTYSHRRIALAKARKNGELAIFDRVENRVIHV